MRYNVGVVQTTHGLGTVKTNKAGQTIIRVFPGIKPMPVPQAIQALQTGQASMGGRWQAIASLVYPSVGSILAGINIDPAKPNDTKTAISDKLKAFFRANGVDAEGRGNVVGQYRSRLAAWFAAGGKLQLDDKGMLPAENAIRVSVEKTDNEIAGGIVDRIINALKAAENDGVTDDVLVMLSALGYDLRLPTGDAAPIEGSAEREEDDETEAA